MNASETDDVNGQEQSLQPLAEFPENRERRRPKGATGVSRGKRLATECFKANVPAEAPESLELASVQNAADVLAPLEKMFQGNMKAVLDEVRFAMMIPRTPRQIAASICKKYGIDLKAAKAAIARVQNEQRETAGFDPYQLLELAQRVLVGVLQQKDRKNSDKLKAIEIADAMFGIALRPDEDAAIRSGAWLR